MTKTIRIATRGSALALWQANAVKAELEAGGNTCKIIIIKSSGDLNLMQPIYTMGIVGVFTKELDLALLNDKADIAVHSLKDVPTQLAEGLHIAAVLQRGAHQDVALIKNNAAVKDKNTPASIATSSLRRKAQWLAKYPHHKTIDIRGNVQTRLKKFYETQEMDAVIFAKAGLERLDLLPADAAILEWMLPAPAQGIIGIVCRSNDEAMNVICSGINHQPSFIAATIERAFMQTLQGGCSVPVSALATINGEEILFHGAVHDFDGLHCFEVKESIDVKMWKSTGAHFAEKILQQTGAAELMEKIRNTKWQDEADIKH